MVEFTTQLSPVQTVTQRATPSAAPLIAQAAGGLLQAGAQVADIVTLSGFEEDVQNIQTDIDAATASIVEETQPLADDGVDNTALIDLGREAARRTLAVEQGVMSRLAAEASIGVLFKSFAAENPHLTAKARRVVGGLGVSLGSGLGSSASTRMSPEEKQAREQANAIRSIQNTMGGTLEEAGKMFVEIGQADMRSKMEPINASELATTTNSDVFNKIATITTTVIDGASLASLSGNFAGLEDLKRTSIGQVEQSRLTSITALNQHVQNMARKGRFISQESINSQLSFINSQYDDLKTMVEGDLTNSSKLMKDRAAFIANEGVDTYNKLFRAALNNAAAVGDVSLSLRGTTFLADSPEAVNRHLNAFAAAKPVLQRMATEGSTLRKALADIGVVGEQRSEIARAVDFLQDADVADIWSFFLRETVKQVEDPTPFSMSGAFGDSDFNDVINSATAAATSGTDDPVLSIPHVTAVFAAPQGLMLSGSFFNKYRSAIDSGQAEKLAQIGDRFASASLTSISSNLANIAEISTFTGAGREDAVTINTEVVSPTGAITVPIPTQPTQNRSIQSIPFIEFNISTAPEFNETGATAGINTSRLSIKDNVKRMNYLLTMLYAAGSPEFKGLLGRAINQFQPVTEEE